MKIKKIAVFSYEDLSDSSKERARADFLKDSDFYWWNDSEASIRSFCDRFNVSKIDYQIGAYSPSYLTASVSNDNFRGLKLADFADAEKLARTGYCVEIIMFEHFYNEWKRTGSALLAFHNALDKGCSSIQKDMEYHESDEFAEEMILANEWEYTEDGEIIYLKEVA